MILSDLTTRALVTRRVTISSGALSIDDTPDEHPAAVRLAGRRETADVDGSPRDHDPLMARWQPGVFAFASTLQPGDRFEIAARLDVPAVEYEVLAPARALDSRMYGYEAPVLPLTELYPLSGQAHDQGDAAAGDQIPVAVWSASERHSDTGTYETLDAEAPPEFASDLTGRNRFLTVGGIAYRVSTAVLDLSPPRVRMTVTRQG